MRILLTVLVSMTFLVTKAQSHLPINTWGYGFTQMRPFTPYPLFTPYTLSDSGNLNRKWQLRQFASVSAGYIFLNGGISYLSAPVGLALIHPLNKNVSAFAAVSAAPTLFSINRLYTDPMAHSNNFSRPYNLGLNARVEGGFIYTNDARTFSISGSMSIEKGSYPVYRDYRTNTKKQ